MGKRSMPSWPAVAALTSATSTAAATTAAAAAIPAATATAARPFFASAGYINSEIAPVQISAIHGTDGFLGFFFSAHRSEERRVGKECRVRVCVEYSTTE